MILLLFIALLSLPAIAASSSSIRAHIADPLRLKCDALPFRTFYTVTRCYFAVNREVKISGAAALCSSLFNGSTVATDVTSRIFNAMMLEKSKFHAGKDSSEAKQLICVQDTGYTCDKGDQSTVLPGKCFERADKKMNFENAETYCNSLGMEVPQIGNDVDNQMLRGALLKDPAWISNIYDAGKWKRERSFSRFSACDRPTPRLWAGNQMRQVCNSAMSSVIDTTGYWGNDGRKQGIWSVICVKDAANHFTEIKKKRVPCIAHHKWDDETGQCEWTGPSDACLQTIDYQGGTWWARMPEFPKETYKALGPEKNDAVVKVIVRRGCMYSGFPGIPYSIPFHNKVLGKNNHGYGVHSVPCYHTGDLPSPGDGLSLLKCFCDPTQATLNGHVPAPPPKKKCIEHHVFNETTQSCEWIHESKFCGELIAYDGRRQKVEIPDWPTNRKYEVDHWENLKKRDENFHVQITEVIVRQHCWFTLHQSTEFTSPVILKTAGYGRHHVDSYYNGRLQAPHAGTHRVVCECLS